MNHIEYRPLSFTLPLPYILSNLSNVSVECSVKGFFVSDLIVLALLPLYNGLNNETGSYVVFISV